jgi:hypothetical protein
MATAWIVLVWALQEQQACNLKFESCNIFIAIHMTISIKEGPVRRL